MLAALLAGGAAARGDLHQHRAEPEHHHGARRPRCRPCGAAGHAAGGRHLGPVHQPPGVRRRRASTPARIATLASSSRPYPVLHSAADRADLDHRLHRAAADQPHHGQRRPARPGRQDHAEHPRMGAAQQEHAQRDQAAQPDRHRGDVHHVGGHDRRRPAATRRRARSAARWSARPRPAPAGPTPADRPAGAAQHRRQQRGDAASTASRASRVTPYGLASTSAELGGRRRPTGRRRCCSAPASRARRGWPAAVRPSPARTSADRPAAGAAARPEQGQEQGGADGQRQSGVPEEL